MATLDYTLLQPANSMFLVTFSRMVIWRVWDLVLAAILIVAGHPHQPVAALTLPNLVSFLFLAVIRHGYPVQPVDCDDRRSPSGSSSSTTTSPSCRPCWIPGVILSTVYPTWLRLIVTFLVPIAVATTVPLQALRGDLTAWQVLLFLGVGAASFLVATRIWKAGVRKYSGASS